MKKLTLICAFICSAVLTIAAQNYMVVNTKEIFNSVEEYTQALAQIDNLGKSYQTMVDSKYNAVESLYNSYMSRQSALNTSERAVYEARIEKAEAEATAYQESIFSQNGELMKKRIEILTPIQERVFNVIESYAKSKNFDLVLDEATSPTILYRSQSVDHTSAVIEELKNNK